MNHKFRSLHVSAVILVGVLITGCRFNIGSTEAVIRPATRIPHVIVESGSGEYIHQEGVDADGEGGFLLIRGSF